MDSVVNNGAVARERRDEVGERKGAGSSRGGGVNTLGWVRGVLKWAFEGGRRSSLFHSLNGLGRAVF